MDRVDGVGLASIFRGDPRAEPVQSDMEEWLGKLLERGGDKHIEARPHLYGSDAGFCARRNVLLANNIWLESTVNSAGKGYMAIGVAFENLLVEALQRAGRFLAGQLRGAELGGLKVSAKFDAIVLDATDQLALLEIKTCGRLPEEEKPAHLAQIQMYSAISGIRNAHLVYLSRDLSPLRPIPMRVFQVDTGDEALLQRLQIANESFLASGGSFEGGPRPPSTPALPPVPATFHKHTECHYCEFRDYFCWGSRPGLGDEPSRPPLRELTPEEYIRLSEQARSRAQGHLYGLPERYLETLRALLRQPGLLPDQKARLRTLEVQALVLGPNP